jgi:flagellar hook-associated protein 2
MAGVIQVGGLATGLDTNKIIDQLVQLERRPIDLLQQQESDIQDSQTAFATFAGKLATLRSAAEALDTADDFLAGKASSSNDAAVSAVAGSGASRGTVTVDVTQLARGSVAGSSTGLASASATVATGDGVFKFQVGSGAVQTVAVSSTTTLADLVTAINAKDAGVTASAVNLGTASVPDYRLNVVSKATGASSTIAVVQDDTSLAIATTQPGLNAEFTVTGFSGTFKRETNTFSDVLAGVSFTLKDEGTATITVNDDADAITTKVKALVTAFNDAVTYADGQSQVTTDGSGTTTVGPLAANASVRRLVDELHAGISSTFTGATTKYVNLSSVGLTTVARDGGTQPVGTIAFDEGAFRSALADDPSAVAALFGGTTGASGIADSVGTSIANATAIDGVLTIDTRGFDDRLRDLDTQIADGTRRLDIFEADLRQQFTALETLVSGLQSQSSFLAQALKNL